MAEMRGPNLVCCWRSIVASSMMLLLLATSIHTTDGATYVVRNTVPNTPGGRRFNSQLGATNMRTVLQEATRFVQRSLSLSPAKNIGTVTLLLENFEGVAGTGGSTIHLSASYVANTSPGNAAALRYEIKGVLYHEVTHVWQNNNGDYGSDKYFRGVIEGIADWIRLRARLAPRGQTRGRRNANANWWDGYSTTAYFLEWIETTKKRGFVNRLNQKMVTPWKNDFFRQIVGTDVNTLWRQYQKSLPA